MKIQAANVKSFRTAQFSKLFAELPEHVRQLAQERFEKLFCVNPWHPALDGRWLPDPRHGTQVWRIAVNNSTRATARVVTEGGTTVFVWFWIGSHEAYNTRFSR